MRYATVLQIQNSIQHCLPIVRPDGPGTGSWPSVEPHPFAARSSADTDWPPPPAAVSDSRPGTPRPLTPRTRPTPSSSNRSMPKPSPADRLRRQASSDASPLTPETDRKYRSCECSRHYPSHHIAVLRPSKGSSAATATLQYGNLVFPCYG